VGIFGDIGGFLGTLANSPFGAAVGAGIAQRIGGNGGPPGSAVIPVALPGQAQFGSGVAFSGFPQIGPGSAATGPFLPPVFTQAALEVPQPVPFGFDPQVPSFFKPASGRASPIRFLTAKNPVTGQTSFWEHAGRPILFSRDLRVCKRVGKIARRAKSRSRK